MPFFRRIHQLLHQSVFSHVLWSFQRTPHLSPRAAQDSGANKKVAVAQTNSLSFAFAHMATSLRMSRERRFQGFFIDSEFGLTFARLLNWLANRLRPNLFVKGNWAKKKLLLVRALRNILPALTLYSGWHLSSSRVDKWQRLLTWAQLSLLINLIISSTWPKCSCPEQSP